LIITHSFTRHLMSLNVSVTSDLIWITKPS